MTTSQVTLIAIAAFAAGCVVVWAPLSDRIRQLIINLAEARADSQALTDKIAQLAADCVELQTLAHEAQELASMEKERADNLIQDCVVLGDIVRADDGSVAMLAAERKKLEMAKGMIAGEIAAHATTKRQLAAARGQITKLRKRLA